MRKLQTISLCMIVKNEEYKLANCLQSVAGVFDELIIVDTGSTDATIEIAKKFTDRVYHFEWIHDFAAARNFSVSKATMDYVMWLDADDIITPQNRKNLLQLKKQLGKDLPDIITMEYHYNHDEYGNCTYIQTTDRMWRRSLGLEFVGAIHEAIPIPQDIKLKIAHCTIFVTHTRNHDAGGAASASFKRNLEILRKVMASGKYTPREMFYYGTSLYTEGDYDEALIWLNRFFKDPGCMFYNGTMAYLFAHRIYLERGDLKNALAVLEDYEERNSHSSEFYTTLGRYCQQYIKDLRKAAEAYNKALNCTGVREGNGRTSRHREFYYFLPHVGLAEICIDLAEYKKAVEHYTKALEDNPLAPDIPEMIKKLTRLAQITERQ